jgi:protein-L-isoaspartate O-methyltransferase
MLTEVLAALAPKDGDVVVDGTLGAGGYTCAILEAARCTVIAIDRDPDAVASARALEHARRAGSHWEEKEIVLDMGIDLYWGPTPVPDAIRWCNDILARAPNDRAIEMGIAHALAHMHARLGDFALARSLAARCLEIANESGQRTLAAVLTEVAADVETLAGEHAVAERMLAEGCAALVAMGEPNLGNEAHHALSRVAGGLPVDGERLADLAAMAGQPSRALLEAAVAATHLAAGALVEADRHARNAVEYFAKTDFITFHADSLMILGDVLRATSRTSEAEAEYGRARDLYRQKGSVVGEKAAAARLAD